MSIPSSRMRAYEKVFVTQAQGIRHSHTWGETMLTHPRALVLWNKEGGVSQKVGAERSILSIHYLSGHTHVSINLSTYSRLKVGFHCSNILSFSEGSWAWPRDGGTQLDGSGATCQARFPGPWARWGKQQGLGYLELNGKAYSTKERTFDLPFWWLFGSKGRGNNECNYYFEFANQHERKKSLVVRKCPITSITWYKAVP